MDRDGTGQRSVPRRPHQERHPAGGNAGRPDRRPDGRRAGGRPPGGHRAPRHQTRQHPAGRRPGRGHRLRHRLRLRRGHPHPERRGHRHPRLHGPRAGQRPRGHPASDLWSLGATLYAAVEGHPPFSGSTPAALLLAVSRGKPAPAQRARLLKPVLRDLMQVAPERRPTAADTAAALSALAGPATMSLPPATEPALSRGAFGPAARPRRPSRRAVLTAFGVVGLAAAVPVTWHVLTREDAPLPGHAESVGALAFSPDGRILATGGNDETVRLWDVDGGDAIGDPLRGHDGAITSIAFSPDGQTLVTCGTDFTVRLWDIGRRAPVGNPLTGHDGVVTSVAFSPDGKVLVTASADFTVRLWDVGKRASIGNPLTGHRSDVTSVAFNRDGRTFVTGGTDHTVRLWNVNGGAQVWDDSSDREHDDDVNSVAFSPNGRIVASGGNDETVRLWDVGNGGRIGDPLQHDSDVTSVAFNRDGVLATACSNGAVRLWRRDSPPLKGLSLV